MGKTASARKGKDPHLRFRIAFEQVEALDEQRVSLHLSEILSFSFLFISFHFFFLKERKKRNGLLVVTRTLSSTERQKKTSNEVVSLRISLLPFIIIIIFSTSVSLVPSP